MYDVWCGNRFYLFPNDSLAFIKCPSAFIGSSIFGQQFEMPPLPLTNFHMCLDIVLGFLFYSLVLFDLFMHLYYMFNYRCFVVVLMSHRTSPPMYLFPFSVFLAILTCSFVLIIFRNCGKRCITYNLPF